MPFRKERRLTLLADGELVDSEGATGESVSFVIFKTPPFFRVECPAILERIGRSLTVGYSGELGVTVVSRSC
jgi:hypothetical protein